MREWLREVAIDLMCPLEPPKKLDPWQQDPMWQRRCDTFRKLVASPECEVVWRALERRCNSSWDHIHLEQLVPQSRPRPSLAAYCLEDANRRDGGRPPPVDHITVMARNLICEIDDLRYSSPNPIDTAANRSRRLHAIETAVAKLKEALGTPTSSDGPCLTYPDQFRKYDSALDRFAIEQLNQWLAPIEHFNLAVVDRESLAVAFKAGHMVVRNPHGYLDALAAGAREWASEVLAIPRPNDVNATRLLFIRRLTTHFRNAHGEPLRACVLAITGVFFDCCSLDESAIAKLAP